MCVCVCVCVCVLCVLCVYRCVSYVYVLVSGWDPRRRHAVVAGRGLGSVVPVAPGRVRPGCGWGMVDWTDQPHRPEPVVSWPVLRQRRTPGVCVCVCMCVCVFLCVVRRGLSALCIHTGPYRGARYRPLVGGAHVERIQSPCVGSMSMQRGEHRALGWPPPRHTVGRRPAREWWQVRKTLAIPVCGLASGVPLLNCGGNSGNHPAECGDCYRWGLVPAFMNQS